MLAWAESKWGGRQWEVAARVGSWWVASLPPSLPYLLACKNGTAQLKTQTQARMVAQHRHTGRARIKTETQAAATTERQLCKTETCTGTKKTGTKKLRHALAPKKLAPKKLALKKLALKQLVLKN